MGKRLARVFGTAAAGLVVGLAADFYYYDGEHTMETGEWVLDKVSDVGKAILEMVAPEVVDGALPNIGIQTGPQVYTGNLAANRLVTVDLDSVSPDWPL